MGKLDGKVAIITGAYWGNNGNSMGGMIAMKMALDGARVVVADIFEEPVLQLVKKIREAGGEATPCLMDLQSEDQIRTLIGKAVSTYGGLDVLHNNAAALPGEGDRDVVSLDLDEWDRIMNISVRGTMLACRHAIPEMLKRGGGSIINTSSNVGLSGDKSRTAYGVSKGAINTLTKYIATQYGKQGIRCNAILPGLILTPTAKATISQEVHDVILANMLTPRLGSPEDIANLAAFLASDEAGFITGQWLEVDGGMCAHMPYTSSSMKIAATKHGH